nr:immunoglobulin superfamily member 1-like [Chrysemys picta bellii]
MGDYGLFKQALLRKFELTLQAYRKRTRGLHKTPGVTYKEVTNLLGEYLRKWGKVTDTWGGFCVSPSHSCLRVNAELPVPRPSISVSPSGVIAPGGAVTIRCQCRCEARRLFLYKGGIQIRELDAAGEGGEFTIPSARREDGWVYTCRSRSRSEPPNWSYSSDIVRIIVAELSYPKPSIYLSPSRGVALGGAVTIQCQVRYQNARFLLYKDGNLTTLEDVELAGDAAEFPIRNVSWRHAGSYSCYYYRHWYPFILSHPSDPVELVVAGELPGSVSPLPAPPPVGPSGAGACARGTNRSRNPLESMGDPVELVVAAAPSRCPDFIHTNIAHLVLGAVVLLVLELILAETYYSSAPSGCPDFIHTNIAHLVLGAMVLLILELILAETYYSYFACRLEKRCDGRRKRRDIIDFLLLAGRAEWVVGTSDPPNWSDPSDYVWIVVPELIFRKPSISLRPSGGVALGGAVTIRCQGRHQNMRFLLYKDGNPNALQDMEPAGDLAEFPIRNVSWRDAGNYSCYYHHKLYPFIWSHPSDPVDLVVAGGTDPTQPPTSTHPGSARLGTRAGNCHQPPPPMPKNSFVQPKEPLLGGAVNGWMGGMGEDPHSECPL